MDRERCDRSSTRPPPSRSAITSHSRATARHVVATCNTKIVTPGTLSANAHIRRRGSRRRHVHRDDVQERRPPGPPARWRPGTRGARSARRPRRGRRRGRAPGGAYGRRPPSRPPGRHHSALEQTSVLTAPAVTPTADDQVVRLSERARPTCRRAAPCPRARTPAAPCPPAPTTPRRPRRHGATTVSASTADNWVAATIALSPALPTSITVTPPAGYGVRRLPARHDRRAEPR